ncbi:endonuclease [Neobacillus drentensis]|uniref:endonuclease n=1 Tax=Neobacillus drentensis TaxID=220684 RepID=UPI003001F7CA
MSDLSKINLENLNMITGKLLGDGSITKQKGRKPRFQFIHAASDKEWCYYCFEKLMRTLPLTPPYYKKVHDNRTLKGYTECFQVQSRTDPFITWLESIWYQDRKKILPFKFLDQFLNEIALAWWYQDDGHLSFKNNIPKKIILSTDNFSRDENLGLRDLLTKRFNLYFKLDSQNRLLLYDQLQINYFLILIDPYIHPSMKRKITPQKHPKKVAKRTTIYLPTTVKLSKPTQEIHNNLKNLQSLFEITMNRDSYIQFYKDFILHHDLNQETKGYQIIFHESDSFIIQSIKNKTGLKASQIISLCFHLNKLEVSTSFFNL